MMRNLILLLLMPTVLAAQQNKPGAGLGLEANLFTGKIIKHTVNFLPPVPDLSTGIDLNITYQTYGKKDWEQRRRYPTIGLGLTYTNYGNDSIYGRCFSIYPNITLNLITRQKLQWTMRIGDGIGFVTGKFGRQPLSDTLNNAIGSTLNDYASFNTDIRYRFNSHWDVQAGINFSHISNASFKQPNLGVNLLGYHLGVRYFPVTSTPTLIKRNLPHLPNRILFQARVALAFTQSNAPFGPHYPVYMASAFVSRRWLSKNKMFAGIDYSYHENMVAFLKNNLIEPGQERKFSYKSAVLFGNEFLLGRLGVVLQLGVYIKQGYLKQDPYYQKIGGNYYLLQSEKGILKELCITGLLKTHKSVAELAEFGIGFGF